MSVPRFRDIEPRKKMDLDTLVNVFFRSEKYKEYAKIILEELKEEPKTTTEISKKHKIPYPSILRVFKQLYDLGLIDRSWGIYKLSRSFKYKLRALQEFWNDYTSE